MKCSHNFIPLIILLVCSSFAKCYHHLNDPESLAIAIKLANSQMKRFPEPARGDFGKEPNWGYTQGVICLSFEQLWQQTGDRKYLDYDKAYADSLITKEGTIKTYQKEEYNLDNINSGKILFQLYTKTQDPKYRLALDVLRDQLKTHPRTSEGGFWHKLRYPNQMWLDGIYMASPFLAQFGKDFGEASAIDDAANQILIIQKHTLDPKTGLNYHGWDESKKQKWANPQTGQSPNFWGRSMGWYCMGMLDVLDFMPTNHPKYNSIKKIFQSAVQAMVNVQDPKTGTWYQVLDQHDKPGNYLESTVSCMMVYAILKGVRKGYLDHSYLNYGKKGYNGILSNFIKENTDGTISLTQCCSVAGLGGNPYRDGSFEYYIKEPVRDNDPKGVGPFIMAAIEMHLAENK